MRTFKTLLLTCLVASFAIDAFGQDLVDVPTTHDRASADTNQTVASYVTASITKPSPGQFNDGVKIWQASGTGWGRSAEYRRRIQGGNYGGILFSDTPTNSTLYPPPLKQFSSPVNSIELDQFSWALHRYELDILWTYEFAPVRNRAVPYVTAGAGGIALNGGSTESGWDRQAALVAGAGSDVRVWRLIVMRVGFTVDSLKASNYSDPTYRSTNTIMVEPRIGFVWALGPPYRR